MSIDLSVKIGTLELPFPVIPASGVWPYEEEFWRGEKLDGMGAVCTKAISLNARKGNSGTRLWETPSGILNSIGLQNIGVQGFIEKYHSMAVDCGRPVIANVVMEREEETEETLMRLQEAGGISAAELNISCPNVDGDGMAWGIEPCSAARAVRSARKVWSGRLWVKMTPQAADPAAVAKAIADEGADALVVANTWLGMTMDMNTGRPAFDRVFAGLSGPAVFPLALRLVWQVCGAVDIPIVGCGGVTSASDCAAMVLAGASAVEVGTAFFRNLNAGAEICDGLPAFVRQYGLSSLAELTGMARK
ncbi:MAG: dihydroorotate dehydrogenase [Synergistaceae bacterium]|nr:dihydroorotate dehydrogenase [Synergistaceae bacterium]